MKKGKKTKLPKIFVQIASYRDPECQHTIKDLFEKARYPDRINIGICWQYIAEEDADCFQVVTRPEQLRIIHVDARQSKGACWARAQTQKLWQGEEYTLQIDSHMRFEPNWDETLINMLAECDSKKPILTAYPPNYTPPNNISRGFIYSMVADKFDENFIFKMNSKGWSDKNLPKKPIKGAFLSGCFYFGNSQLIKDVPYDPNIYFFGEEITMAVRLWTNGWDLYHPNKNIIYHDWDRKRRRTHFDDHSWQKRNERSYKRVRYLLGTEPSYDPLTKQDLKIYGLGKARTLEQYQEFSGVNFTDKTISENAKKGIFGVKSKSTKPALKKSLNINLLSHSHTPKKVYDGPEGIVFDDFLPEETYQKLYDFALTTDYNRINTTGTAKVWHINDGFPLRSDLTAYYYAKENENSEKHWAYPTFTGFDLLIESLLKINPQVKHLIGEPQKDWAEVTATSWIYPVGTALSLHDDGANVYNGAYTYYLNPSWQLNWGGLLILMGEKTNKLAKSYKDSLTDKLDFHKKQWLDEATLDSLMWEPGLAKCIFPKRNRIVFIANDAYHMVTKVNPEAGDKVRMSLAGFFIIGDSTKNSKPTY